MGQQSIRQEARRGGVGGQAKRGRGGAAREKRVGGLAVRVLVAVGERDAAVIDAERRAGEALRVMTEDEGLSVREAVEWCGDEITTRDMTRLRRLVEDNGANGCEVDDRNSTPDAAEGLALRSARKEMQSTRDAAAS